jgi:hypothetical protein
MARIPEAEIERPIGDTQFLFSSGGYRNSHDTGYSAALHNTIQEGMSWSEFSPT